jgi:hypothetical protein
VQAVLSERRIKLSISPAALQSLCNIGFDPVYGARPLRRTIESHIVQALSPLILAGRVRDNDAVLVLLESERSDNKAQAIEDVERELLEGLGLRDSLYGLADRTMPAANAELTFSVYREQH